MAERNYLPEFMVRSKAYSTARKPPGGDTNDIFGLEARQRESSVAIYTDRRMKNTAFPGKLFVFIESTKYKCLLVTYRLMCLHTQISGTSLTEIN